MKIGIPRALLYYYYFPFWNTLFTECGCTVVVSDETNKKIISDGSRVTETEMCVPIKIFNGHVSQLLSKDVDYIFVPQMHTVSKEYYCPKFLGIIEVVKYSFLQNTDKFLFLSYDTKTDDLSSLKVHLPLCEKLNISRRTLKQKNARMNSACLIKADILLQKHMIFCLMEQIYPKEQQGNSILLCLDMSTMYMTAM